MNTFTTKHKQTSILLTCFSIPNTFHKKDSYVWVWLASGIETTWMKLGKDHHLK